MERQIAEILEDLRDGKLDRSELKLKEKLTIHKYDHNFDPPKLIETVEQESVTPL